jgi:hypothetical protein
LVLKIEDFGRATKTVGDYSLFSSTVYLVADQSGIGFNPDDRMTFAFAALSRFRNDPRLGLQASIKTDLQLSFNIKEKNWIPEENETARHVCDSAVFLRGSANPIERPFIVDDDPYADQDPLNG